MEASTKENQYVKSHIGGIEEFSSKSIEYMESQKEKLHIFANQLRDIFEHKIYKDEKCIIQGRVKNPLSLKEKIYRKNYYSSYKDKDNSEFILKLPDLIGIRVICLLNKDEVVFYNKLRKYFGDCDSGFSPREFSEIGKLELLLEHQPELQKNGHPIYRITGRFTVDGNTYAIELQIKSMVHSFWGEMEHSMFYKNYQCVISDNLFAAEMNNINKQLDLIDHELGELHSHYNRNEVEKIKEVKEMTMLIIEKNFKDIFEKIYGCNIDLREVYKLVVDIWFSRTKNLQKAINSMNDLITVINRIDQTAIITAQESIKSQIKEIQIKDRNLEFVKKVHKCLVEKGDVFWISFYSLFVVIFNSNEDTISYEKKLNEIAFKLFNLDAIIVFRDNVSINNDKDKRYLMAIHDAIFSEFNYKISYFTDDNHIKVMQLEIEKFIVRSMDVFNSLEEEADIKEGLDEVYWMVCCLIEKSLYKKIDIMTISKLNDVCSASDFLSINFNRDYYDELVKNNLTYLESDEGINNFHEKYAKLLEMEN